MVGTGLLSISSSLAGPLGDAANLVFYREIHSVLHGAFDAFGARLFERMMAWAGTISITLLTLWIMLHGYRITTGQSRESMAAFLIDMVKAIVVVTIATGTAFAGGTLYDWLCNLLPNQINRLVADHDGDLYASIDRTFGYMQMGLSSIGDILTADNGLLEGAKTRNQGFVLLGTGVPAAVAGTLLLLYQASLAMLVGFAPLGVLSLLFKRTESFFWNWLYYLLSVLVAQAVLSVMAAFLLDAICAVAASFWAGKLLGSNPEGINNLAMQQGGLGLIATVLLMSVPAAVAKIFKGLLGEFMPVSAFGGGAAAAQASRRPTPQAQARTHTDESEHSQAAVQTHAYRVAMPASTTAHEDRVKPAKDTRSFLERYPNATASLGEPIGRGDPLPLRTRHTADWSTGYGDSVDEIVALSPTLKADIEALKEARWQLGYEQRDQGSKVLRDQNPPRLLIDSKWRDNPKEMLRALTHEVGHARNHYVSDHSTKKAYMQGTLADEAAAMMKNIQIRREILANSGGQIDIGLNGTAANHAAYNAAYDQCLIDGDEAAARKTIGDIFADKEKTRSMVDKRPVTYREYYGEYYDITH